MPEIVGRKALALANPSMYADENGLVAIAIQPDAERHLEVVLDRITQHRKASTSPFAKALLVRSFEKLERVAGVLAVWDVPNLPVMTLEHVVWAEQFISASDTSLLQFTADYMHGGQVQADASLVLRTVGKILGKDIKPQRANEARSIQKGLVPWSMALRACKLDKKRMDDAVNHLIDLGDVSIATGEIQQANGGVRKVKLLRREVADE